MRNELPAIDPRNCTACGDCIALCPTACLTPRREAPDVEPLSCIGCGLCAVICPSGAITMVGEET